MFDLHLSNYRSFKEDHFRFSKINILIGENSSGKSSLFKFLLSLKQTFIQPRNREYNLLFSGLHTDLGSFKESVYYHDENLSILFSFTFMKEYDDYYLKYYTSDLNNDKKSAKVEELKKNLNLNNNRTKIEYIIDKNIGIHESIQTKISNAIGSIIIIHKQDSDNNYDNLYGQKCSIQYSRSSNNRHYSIENVEYIKDGFTSIIVGSSIYDQIKKIIESEQLDSQSIDSNPENIDKECDIIFDEIAYLLIAQNYLKHIINKTEYINPINTHPSRVYLYKDLRQSPIISNIEDVVEYLSQSNEVSKKALIEIQKTLQKFGIADSIEIIQDDRLPVKELRVQVKDLVSNILDVGYGVSLQIPILLKAILSERLPSQKNSILLIEQPEVHLHPKLHAELIDTLLSFSRSTTYFIETHSEHIIRKLQTIVKEKKHGITPEDVTIHYLRRIDKKTEITSHKIDESGILNPSFPSGFFDNSYNLAKQLLD